MTTKDDDWLAAGVGALEHGQYDEAVSDIVRALALDPQSAPAHYYLAITYRYLNRFDEALDHIVAALERAPLIAVNWAEMGLILGELGREEESLAYYDRSITLDPEQAIPRYNKAVALNQLKRFQEAFVTFQEVITLSAETELVAATHAGMASALYGQGKPREALTLYDQAIALDPANLEAQQGRTRVLGMLASDIGGLEDPERLG